MEHAERQQRQSARRYAGRRDRRACQTGLGAGGKNQPPARPASARGIMNPMAIIPLPLLTMLMLVISNVFMTFAWYGHLKYKEYPLLPIILVSWGIALFEYFFQVPANRWGSAVFSTVQLKTIQEVITL